MFSAISQKLPGQNLHSLKYAAIAAAAGSLFRIYFAVKTEIWKSAYDQLAWALSFDPGFFDTLFRLFGLQDPFSGVKIIFSIPASLIGLFVSNAIALTVTALLADFLVRMFQVKILSDYISSSGAKWFALWQVFALPFIIPLSAAFFHPLYFCSVLPFVLVWLYHSDLRRKNLFAAIICGLSLNFSPFAIALIPFWLVLNGSMKLSGLLRFLLWLLLFSLPFILSELTRQQAGTEKLWPADGKVTEWLESSFLNISLFWTQTLPAAFFMEPVMFMPYRSELLLALAFIIYFTAMNIFHSESKYKKAMWTFILSFCLLYSVSNVFYAKSMHIHFYNFRHIGWAIPLLMTLFFSPQQSAKNFQALINSVFIITSALMSIFYVADFPKSRAPYYPSAAWILAGKYDQSPKALEKIAMVQDSLRKQDLLFGFGWSAASATLEYATSQDTASVGKLYRIQMQYHPENRSQFAQGSLHAFAKGITPKLDPALRNLVAQKLLQQ